MSECFGVDFQTVHAWNRKNPKGVKKGCIFGDDFKEEIRGRHCLEVINHGQWWASEDALSALGEGFYKALNSLSSDGFFNLIPVVIWQDPEDRDISVARWEIPKGMVQFQIENGEGKDTHRLVSLSEEEKVIWVIQPTHMAMNADHAQYVDDREERFDELCTLIKGAW